MITVLSVLVGIRQAKNIQAEGAVPSDENVRRFFSVKPHSFHGLVHDRNVLNTGLRLGRCSISRRRLHLHIRVSVGTSGAHDFETRTGSDFRRRELEIGEHQHPFWRTLGGSRLLVLTSLIGFILALAIFLLCFFIIRARESIFRSLVFSVSGIGFMLFMGWL